MPGLLPRKNLSRRKKSCLDYKLTSVVTGIFFMFVGGLEISITLLLNDIKKIFGKENVEPVTNIDDDENQNE